MASNIGVVNALVQRVGAFEVSTRLAKVEKAVGAYGGLTDDALRKECAEALNGGNFVRRSDVSLLTMAREWVAMKLDLQRLDSLSTHRLALGIEAFTRAPADLGDSRALFREQRQAAVALMQRALVQMDTGEGKTYALLPAAFALCCRYHRVYIVCANDYLAQRDAERTAAYWRFTGLEAGCCVDEGSGRDWSTRVIYTTLRALMFRQLANEVSLRLPQQRVSFGAVILDEADAILLDQADQKYVNSEQMPPNTVYDWARAIRIAATLRAGQDIEPDRRSLTARLTLDGQIKLDGHLGTDKPDIEAARLRYAVEYAFVASRMVEEGQDYIMCGYAPARPVQIDPRSGELLLGQTSPWLIALEALRDIEPRPEPIVFHSLQPRIFLRQFAHLSGLSGTIETDSLEYFAAYKLPCIAIAPRKKRHDGLKPELVYRTDVEAKRSVVEHAKEALAEGRPSLIVAQSTIDAADLRQRLATSVKPFELNGKMITPHVELLTYDEADCARILTDAGIPGAVTIGTRRAGRGIDIRLTDEAKASGGLSIIALGHARDIRHDRQIMGRAGRQGERWTGVFISHLGDEMLSAFNVASMDNMLVKLGLKEDEAIQHEWIDRSLAMAQKKMYENDFLARRADEPRLDTYLELRMRIRKWFEYAQAFDHALRTKSSNGDSDSFVRYVVDRYADANLSPLVKQRRKLTQSDAEQLIASLRAISPSGNAQLSLPAYQLEGQSPRDAIAQIKKRLLEAVHSRILMGSDAAQRVRDAVQGWLLERQKQPAPVVSATAPSALSNFSDISTTATWDDTIISTDGALDHAALLRLVRHPAAIANWTLKTGYRSYLEIEEREYHRSAHEGLAPMHQARVLRSRLFDEWDKFEKEVSEQLLANLLKADRVDELDTIFEFQMQASSFDVSDELTGETQKAANRSGSVIDASAEADVTAFLDATMASFEGDERRKRIQEVLNGFLRQSPYSAMKTPSEIELAAKQWLQQETRMDIKPGRRQEHLLWVERLLVHLNNVGKIGTLPRPGQTRKSAFDVVTSMSPNRTICMLWAALAVLTFPLMSLIPAGPLGQATGSVWWLQSLVLGPLTSWGAITIPAVASLLGSAFIVALLLPNRSPHKGKAHDRLASPLLSGLTAAYILWGTWTFDGVVSVAGFVVLFLVMVCYARALTNWVWNLDNFTGLNLIQLWLCFTSLFVLWRLVELSGRPLELWLSALVATSAFWMLAYASRRELTVRSTRIVTNQLSAEPVSSRLEVPLILGLSPLVASFVVALVVGEKALARWKDDACVSEAATLSASVAFLLVFALFTWRTVRQQFGHDVWTSRLHNNREVIDGFEADQSRQALLRSVRRRLFATGIGIVAAALAIVAYVLATVPPVHGLPVSIGVVLIGGIVAQSALALMRQIRIVIHDNATVSTSEVLNLSYLDRKPKGGKLKDRAGFFVRNRLPTIVLVTGLLAHATTLWPRIWEWSWVKALVALLKQAGVPL